MPTVTWRFKPKEDAEDIIRSAKIFARAIVRPDIRRKLQREGISLAVWKVTEAHGKHNLRYKSAAVEGKRLTEVRHEHVYQRRLIVNDILNDPASIDRILDDRAVACLVTVEEDRRLALASKSLDGWERYKAAGIVVADTLTGKQKIP